MVINTKLLQVDHIIKSIIIFSFEVFIYRLFTIQKMFFGQYKQPNTPYIPD